MSLINDIFPTTGYYWSTSVFQLYNGTFNNNWIKNGSGSGIYVNSSFPYSDMTPSVVWKNTRSYKFKQRKTYQVITNVSSFHTYSVNSKFSSSMEWGDFIDYDSVNRYGYTSSLLPPPPGNGYLFFYSSPGYDIDTKNMVRYNANRNFGPYQPTIPDLTKPTEVLNTARLNEIDFNIQGFAWWRDNNSGANSSSLQLSASSDGLGWCYYDDSKSYIWFDDVNGVYKPALSLIAEGKNMRVLSRSSYINYLSKYIEFGRFNISFTFTKISGSASDGLNIYLSQEAPENRYSMLSYYQTGVTNSQFIPSTAQLIASYTQSGSTFSYYFGLTGKQYLIITASQSSGNTLMALSNINIEGGYWSGNNRRFVTNDSNDFTNSIVIKPSGLTGATFSTYSGTGNTYNGTQSLEIQKLFSKIGNGKFIAGIWENGVWNSGWRYDEDVYEMYEIDNYYTYDRGKIWRFEISGPESTVSKFQVGDKISIGNIIAIDFNEERKLLKGYYSILSKTTNTITLEFINNFPLVRIQRDSNNHRILISKNIWLSGVFVNGYYKGIWNSGLFKGYPLLTEMYDSHWIDGIFDGGHFYSNYYSTTFSNTYFISERKVGLSFSSPHKLSKGDLIYIDKSNKNVNSSYDGMTTVTDVINEYQISTDIDFVSTSTQSETGIIYTKISSGLIQNFTFRSNNTSKSTSVDFLDSDAVFLYNSWIDVNYYTQSAVNIGRPNTLRNPISKIEYSANNLYGYPTDDVLSSVSTFRNSYNNQSITLNLGNKFKIHDDYIGDSSGFSEYFDPTNVDAQSFMNLGWTYSSAGPNSIIFSRSTETRPKFTDRTGYTNPWVNVSEELLIGSELQVDARSSGGVLNTMDPLSDVDFRKSGQIKKDRYSMVEFDLVRWNIDSKTFSYIFNDSLILNNGNRDKPNILQPIIHFDNLNVVNRDVYYSTIGTISVTVPATYLPVYENVNHILTDSSKKVEYFYNKKTLSMSFRGAGWYGSSTASVLIDNLKFYEVDMIPFFQYFTRQNINFGVQVPYQAIAPFIDYSNASFQFLDNVSIGIDSFTVRSSNVAISGISVGIGMGSVNQNVYSPITSNFRPNLTLDITDGFINLSDGL